MKGTTMITERARQTMGNLEHPSAVTTRHGGQPTVTVIEQLGRANSRDGDYRIAERWTVPQRIVHMLDTWAIPVHVVTTGDAISGDIVTTECDGNRNWILVEYPVDAFDCPEGGYVLWIVV
jgi:hypothetical protein